MCMCTSYTRVGVYWQSIYIKKCEKQQIIRYRVTSIPNGKYNIIFYSVTPICKLAKSECWLRRVCPPVRPSVCPSVCPSVYLFFCMKQLSSHWRDFYEILYWIIFRKSVEKIRITLKYQNKNRQFTWRPMSIYDNMSLIFPYIEKWFRQKF